MEEREEEDCYCQAPEKGKEEEEEEEEGSPDCGEAAYLTLAGSLANQCNPIRKTHTISHTHGEHRARPAERREERERKSE